jgi:hypothetical protein
MEEGLIREELLRWVTDYPDKQGYISDYVQSSLRSNFDRRIIEQLTQEKDLVNIIERMTPNDKLPLLDSLLEGLDRACLLKIVQVSYCTSEFKIDDVLSRIDFNFYEVERAVFLEHVTKLSRKQLRNVVLDILDYENIIEEEDEGDFGPSVSDLKEDYGGAHEVYRPGEEIERDIDDAQLRNYLEQYRRREAQEKE